MGEVTFINDVIPPLRPLPNRQLSPPINRLAARCSLLAARCSLLLSMPTSNQSA
jgi:hypothetical protein